MAIFRRRNQNQANVPAEIQEYYQTERRERAGIAWLLAIGTLLVTIALANGIFFAGRWAYRKVADDKKPQPAQVATENKNQEEQRRATSEEEQKDKEEEQENQNQTTPPPQTQNQPTPTPEAQTPPTPTPAPTPPPAAAPPTTPAQQPATGGSGSVAAASNASSPLPTTGPSDMLAIFVAVSLLGYLLHKYFLSANTSKIR